MKQPDRRPVAGIFTWAAVTGGALAFGVPLLITFLYRTEVPLLRDLLAGRHSHPLGEYLADWHLRSRVLLMGVAAITACLLLLTLGRVQALLDRVLGPPPAADTIEPRAGMSRPRWLFVNITIAAIAGMQLLELVTPGDRWPFSPYAMYAAEHGPSIAWRGIYGVSEGREFRLHDTRYYPPIDPARMSYAFAERRRRSSTIVPPQDSMLRAVASLYERARIAGNHDGAPLGGIRLYEDTWELRRDLANVDTPEQHLLLREVRLDE